MWVCRNCGERVVKASDGCYVHANDDEDPRDEFYGWVKCQPTETGEETGAEPITTRQADKEGVIWRR